MTLRFVAAAAFLGGLLLAPPTEAQIQPFSRFGAQAGIGTTGPGLGIVTNVSPRVNLRATASLFSEDYLQPIGVDIDTDQDVEGTSFNLDNEIDYFQAGLLVDFVPVRAVRLSAGVFYAKRDLSSTLRANEAVTEGGVTYEPDEIGTLRLEGSFGSSLAPYVGLGLGNTLGDGKLPVGLYLELGGYFHGSPDLTLVADDPDSMIAPTANVGNEEALEERLGWYKFYPEVSVGLAFRLK